MIELLPVCLQRIDALGFEVFTAGDYNLNLFGIRSKERQAGAFDDLLGCAYLVGRSWQVRYWPATTDPGWFYLQNASERFGVDGTAILVADRQYRSAYRIGPHGRTRYAALVQTEGPVDLHRDATRDRTLDAVPENIVEGLYAGINIHASSMDPYNEDRDRTEASVGPWSAGCQVHATAQGFRDMMDLCNKQIETHPTWLTFTYTLLNQWW